MFLVIFEMIEKMSWGLGGDQDSVDHAIGNRLNKTIVGVNKRSKAMCPLKPLPRLSAEYDSPTLMPPTTMPTCVFDTMQIIFIFTIDINQNSVASLLKVVN